MLVSLTFSFAVNPLHTTQVTFVFSYSALLFNEEKKMGCTMRVT